MGAADTSITTIGTRPDQITTSFTSNNRETAKLDIPPFISTDIAELDVKDSFARHAAKPIDVCDIIKVTKKFHQELKELLDGRGTTMSETDFDIYKTAFLQRYVKLIGDKIITMEDHTVLEFTLMLEGLKKEYSIKFGISVGTDPNNPETISAALKEFDAIVTKAFDSVKDDESLQTEITRVRDFLDKNKNVLSHIPTRDVIIKNFWMASHPLNPKINRYRCSLLRYLGLLSF